MLSKTTKSRRRFLAGIGGAAAALALRPAGALAALVPPSFERRRRPEVGVAAGPSLSHLAWVWQFRHDGDREQIRSVLAEHRMGIVLKTHDGLQWMSRYDTAPGAVSGPKRIEELAAYFEAGGVPFHCWCNVHGVDPVREAEMASQVLDAGARSIAFDLESYRGFWRGTPQIAVALGRELRARQPNALIWTTIDARPWEADRIPLEEFAAFSDAIAPQAYWSDFGSASNVAKYRQSGEDPGEEGVTPRFVLGAAFRRLRSLGLPMHPIGPGLVDDREAWTEFLEESFALDVEAVSVWRFGTTAPGIFDLLKELPPRPLVHVVESGDTLSALALRWRTDVAAIVTLNGLRDPNALSIGQQLTVPRKGRGASVVTYTVEEGDSLYGLALRWDTTVEQLAAMNGIADPSLLSIGQKIVIPRAGAAPAAPAAPVIASYVVRRGDTLSELAELWETTPERIAELNRLGELGLIRIGQELLIPS